MMERFVIYISGNVQKAGYRSKVVTIARAFGIKGSVQNLPDGRVKVIAEGEVPDLDRFADALNMRNAIIDVTAIERERSGASGEYEGFFKLVEEGETDARLDRSVEYLKELVDVTKGGFERMERLTERGFGDLGHKMDQMLEKQDQMLEKQDQMLEKQDETTGEIRELRRDLKSHIDMRFERIEADLAEVKTALREKGII